MPILHHSAILYFSTVFIWGSTFFAIKFQLGEVPTEVSVAYRFAIAAAILMAWCWIRRLSMRFEFRQHLWILAQGLTLFGFNYLVVYWATAKLTSGLIAVLFSTIVMMNIANTALVFGKQTTASVIVGALTGFIGICFVFLPEIVTLEMDSTALKGILLSLLGTFIASLGNMVSTRNQKEQLPVVQTNAYGMAYGAAALGLFALTQGASFNYEPTLAYTASLLYLALFGSVFAFGSFLTLLGRIGAEKAAYVTVLFPIVALGISTLFEDYRWSLHALIGVSLILVGNILIIMSPEHVKRFSQTFR